VASALAMTGVCSPSPSATMASMASSILPTRPPGRAARSSIPCVCVRISVFLPIRGWRIYRPLERR
jgi:hypothetical protein